MIHAARSIYEALPPGVRAVIGATARNLPVRLRYGNAFINAMTEARSVDAMNPQELEAAAGHKLRECLARASRSKRWAGVFSAVGLDLTSVTAVDLKRLPFTSKDDLRDGLEEIVIPIDESSRKWATTGGTTGAPVGFWLDKDASAVDWAYTVHVWSRIGFALDDPRVILRGVRFGTRGSRALSHYEPLRRELYLSAFDLDTNHLPYMRAQIAGFAPKFIHGYPSAMDVLGASYSTANEDPPALRALLAVSENLYPGQRERLETMFRTRLFSFYGLSEKAAFAAECERSSELHVEPLYGLVELVDDSGTVIEESGVVGEIVATSFVNRAVALIRYRTGDYASWAAGPCACGRRHRRLCDVRGRWTQEYLVGNSGARISMTALNLHSAVTNDVSRFQFVQRLPGEADLLIEGAAGATLADLSGFIAALEEKLSGHLTLRPMLVERIELTGRGKQRFIVQEIPSQ